jgi:hypothetical protein
VVGIGGIDGIGGGVGIVIFGKGMAHDVVGVWGEMVCSRMELRDCKHNVKRGGS